jgi:hypothetical protein
MQILARNSATNALSAMSPRRQWMSAPAGVDLFLTAGGDERIVVDPVTKRNRYATTATPSRREIFLSSSTASTITSGYRAVEMAWAELTVDTNGDCQGINAWFDPSGRDSSAGRKRCPAQNSSIRNGARSGAAPPWRLRRRATPQSAPPSRGVSGEASRAFDCTWDRASKRVACVMLGWVVVHPFDVRSPP